jgi:RNA polymerase sigma factor (sigma-70 family)
VSLDEQLDECVAQTSAWLRDPSLSPEQLFEQAEMRTVFLDAMQELLPEQRAVIVMRYFLEMSEADMSARMNRPLSAIKWWLREASKRLRWIENGIWIEMARFGGVESIAYLDQDALINLAESMEYEP